MFKVVVFDAYGTLFDVYSVGALAEQLFPGHGAALSAAWRDKQIEYTRLTTMSDPHGTNGSRYYQPFQELTAASLRYCCKRLGLNLGAAEEMRLMQQYEKLTPFAENLGVLKTLHERGIKPAILSNGSTAMLTGAVNNAGMAPYLNKVITVDSIRLFKTSPECYGLILKQFPVRLDEVLFVSSNAWDALGGTWFGFKTLWVNRQGLPFEEIGPRPTHIGSNLEEVLRVI